MEINDDLAHDEFEVVNAVTSSVRTNRIQQHREYIIDNWRKKEIFNMKKVIVSLTVKRDCLKKKRKKLTEYSKENDNNFEMLLKVDVPLSQTALSVKYKFLSKKKTLDKLKKECDENLKRHTEFWDKSRLKLEEIPEIKMMNDLVRKLESLREDKNKVKSDQNNKKEKNLLTKKRFENAVVKFAEGMSAINKTKQMVTENRRLVKMIGDYEEKIKSLRDQIDRQIEFRIGKELEKKNCRSFICLDFEDFDSSQNIASAGHISNHDASMSENDFDPDCTNLSLDMSTDHPFSLTIGTDRNLGTPIAMSTPLCAEATNQATEHQITPTSTPSPSKQEKQVLPNAFPENNLSFGNPKLTMSQQPMSQNIISQNNKLSQLSYTTNPQIDIQGENGQSVRNLMSERNENVDITRNEQINNAQDTDQETVNFDNTNTDKISDVDYKERYARSPDDQSILCEEPNSPPVRLTMPSFNSYKPPQAASNLMSFFDFGNSKQQKTDAASILDMF